MKAKKNDSEFTSQTLRQGQGFVTRVKVGAITPFEEKTERGRRNLKEAKLIK